VISFALIFLINAFFFACALLVAFFATWLVSDILTQYKIVSMKPNNIFVMLLSGFSQVLVYPLLATFLVSKGEARVINLFACFCLAIPLTWLVMQLSEISYSISIWPVLMTLLAFVLHYGFLRLVLPEYFDAKHPYAPHDFEYRENAGEQ